MVQATWNGAVIAESDDTVMVEGNHYFPPEAIRQDMLEGSRTTSRCPWKGTANYYTVVVGEERNVDAAWHYDDPLPAAAEITGRVAFWKGVKVG